MPLYRHPTAVGGDTLTNADGGTFKITDDTSPFGQGLVHMPASPAVDTNLMATHNLSLYAAGADDGLGVYTPAITMSESGAIIMTTNNPATLGNDSVNIVATDGFNVSADGSIVAHLKTDLLSISQDYHLPDASGTVALLSDLSDILNPRFQPRDYGAVADGSTDDKTAIDATIAAARTAYIMSGRVSIVDFGGGNYATSGGHTIWGSMIYDGGFTHVFLLNGSDDDVFISNDFASLTGTNNPVVGGDPTGEGDFIIRDMFLIGNKAAQSGPSSGIRLYGYNFYISNVFAYDFKADGFYTEWGSLGSLSAPTNNMEATLQNCKSSNNDGKGFNINGPHDSRLNNCYAYGNASNQFYTGGGTAGAAGTWFSGCHGYSNATSDVATVEFDAISCVWSNSNAEASSGTVGVRILRNDCRVEGGGEVIDPQSGSTIGIQLGDLTHQVANCTVDTKIHTCDNTSVYIANSGGYNYVNPKVFQDGGTVFTGTPASGDYVAPKDGSQIYGIAVGCVTVSGTDCPAVYLPDPFGTAYWCKLGTWTASSGTGGGRLTLTVTGTGGYNADSTTAGQTVVQIATGNGAPTPNAGGVWWTQNGNAMFDSVKLNKGATTDIWEVYAHIVSTYTGNSYMRADTGSTKYPSTFVYSMSSTSDPGAASSTIAVLTEQFGVTSPIQAANVITKELYVRSPAVAAAQFIGPGDGNQYSNFVLADDGTPTTAGKHYWAFSHRASHEFWMFNYNGTTFTNTLILTEAGDLTIAGALSFAGVSVSGTAPTAGQILTASSPTAAAWASPTSATKGYAIAMAVALG
jgi:hypothetical protein